MNETDMALAAILAITKEQSSDGSSIASQLLMSLD